MPKANIHTPHQSNPDIIEGFIARAKTSYINAKDGASEAIANTYMVYLDVCSSEASQIGKDWFKKAVEDRNAVIKAHNTEIDDIKKSAPLYKTEKLPKNHTLMQDIVTDEDQEIHDALIAKYTHYLELTDYQRGQLKRVQLEIDDDEKNYINIVKLVLELDYTHQSDVMSRYATVLEWTDNRFEEIVIEDTATIVSAIKEAGGFERVLRDQRQIKANTVTTDDETQARKLIYDAVIKQNKSTIREAQSLATFSRESLHSRDGMVFLVGSYEGGKIEIKSEVRLADGEYDAIVSRFDNKELIETDTDCEVLSRVIDLGQILQDKAETNKTEADLKNSKKIKTSRMMVIRHNEQNELEIVVTQGDALSTPIIYVTPKSTEAFGSITEPLAIEGDYYSKVQRLIKDRCNRQFTSVTPCYEPINARGEPVDAPMSWVFHNEVLIKANSALAHDPVILTNLEAATGKPVDVDYFKEAFRFEISALEIQSIYVHFFKPWLSKMQGNKSKVLVGMTLKNNSLTFALNGQQDYVVSLDKGIMGQVTMHFLPREFHDLFLELCDHHAKSYQFRGDTGGLLEIAWEDHIAGYKFFMPTGTKDAKLESRRIAPMTSALLQAAE